MPTLRGVKPNNFGLNIFKNKTKITSSNSHLINGKNLVRKQFLTNRELVFSKMTKIFQK